MFILFFFRFRFYHMQNWRLVHRPLASFSTMRFTDYRASQPQSQSTIASTIPSTPPLITPVEAATPPLVTPVVEKQKLKITIKKKHPVPPAPAPLTPVEKQKLKITIVKKKPFENPTTENKIKIKITIKKQPKQKEEEEEEQQQPQRVMNDIAPPASMIYNPCSDYIAPPPKCCRFFIDNRHCFLRSSDNACIHPTTKEVFGFWNCEIGEKCKLLPLDDNTVYEVYQEAEVEKEKEKENKDFSNNQTPPAVEMRKKSDANRSRLAGQPVAILRHKIAMQYGMHSFNSLGNRIRTHSTNSTK